MPDGFFKKLANHRKRVYTDAQIDSPTHRINSLGDSPSENTQCRVGYRYLAWKKFANGHARLRAARCSDQFGDPSDEYFKKFNNSRARETFHIISTSIIPEIYRRFLISLSRFAFDLLYLFVVHIMYGSILVALQIRDLVTEYVSSARDHERSYFIIFWNIQLFFCPSNFHSSSAFSHFWSPLHALFSICRVSSSLCISWSV